MHENRPLLPSGRYLSINYQVALAVTLLFLVFAVIVGVLSYQMNKREVVESYGFTALGLAGAVATQIDGDEFARIMQTRSVDEHWQKYKDAIVKTRTATQADFIYLMAREDDGQFRYLASSLYDTSLRFKLAERIFPRELASVYRTGDPAISGVYDADALGPTDYGFVVSGFVPIFDSSKTLVGTVGVDIGLNRVLETANAFGIKILLAGLILLVITALLIMLFTRKVLGKPIQAIAEAARNLAKGELDIADLPA